MFHRRFPEIASPEDTEELQGQLSSRKPRDLPSSSASVSPADPESALDVSSHRPDLAPILVDLVTRGGHTGVVGAALRLVDTEFRQRERLVECLSELQLVAHPTVAGVKVALEPVARALRVLVASRGLWSNFNLAVQYAPLVVDLCREVTARASVLASLEDATPPLRVAGVETLEPRVQSMLVKLGVTDTLIEFLCLEVPQQQQQQQQQQQAAASSPLLTSSSSSRGRGGDERGGRRGRASGTLAAAVGFGDVGGDEHEDEDDGCGDSADPLFESQSACLALLAAIAGGQTALQLSLYRSVSLFRSLIPRGLTVTPLLAALFAGNIGLVSRVEASDVRWMIAAIEAEGLRGPSLDLLRALVEVHGETMRKNQTMVVNTLLGRRDVVLTTYTGPEGRRARTELLAAAARGDGDAQRAVDYYIGVLELLSACCRGLNRLTETVIQPQIPLHELCCDVADISLPPRVRVALIRYFNEVFLETEAPVAGLEEAPILFTAIATLAGDLTRTAMAVERADAAEASSVGDGAASSEAAVVASVFSAVEAVLPALRSFFTQVLPVCEREFVVPVRAADLAGTHGGNGDDGRGHGHGRGDEFHPRRGGTDLVPPGLPPLESHRRAGHVHKAKAGASSPPDDRKLVSVRVQDVTRAAIDAAHGLASALRVTGETSWAALVGRYAARLATCDAAAAAAALDPGFGHDPLLDGMLVMGRLDDDDGKVDGELAGQDGTRSMLALGAGSGGARGARGGRGGRRGGSSSAAAASAASVGDDSSDDDDDDDEKSDRSRRDGDDDGSDDDGSADADNGDGADDELTPADGDAAGRLAFLIMAVRDGTVSRGLMEDEFAAFTRLLSAGGDVGGVVAHLVSGEDGSALTAGPSDNATKRRDADTTIGLLRICQRLILAATIEERPAVQRALSDAGVLELVLRRVAVMARSRSRNERLLRELLRTAHALFKDGNEAVQDEAHALFSTAAWRILFFQGLDDEIEHAITTLKLYRKTSSRRGADEALREHLIHARLVMTFMQLTCEGHHAGMQAMLRGQQDGGGISVNLVEATSSLWMQLARTLRPPTVPLARQVLATLIEMVQGPCAENQIALSRSTLFDAANSAFRSRHAHIGRADAVHVQADTLLLLSSMLESRPDFAVHQAMVTSLDIAVLIKIMFAPPLPEGKVSVGFFFFLRGDQFCVCVRVCFGTLT
jgi:hypothetical protein